MSEKQAVVYTARDKQQAHVLRNLLEEAGIEAVVTGHLVSEGTGVEAAGWATVARVMVAEQDAKAARRLVEQFEGRPPPAPAAGQAPEQEAVELAEWPVCPECGARRATTCPVCQTSGTDFPQADSEFMASPELEEGAGPTSCDCGSGGCSSSGPKTGDESAPAEADAGEVTDAAEVADGGTGDEAAHEEAGAPGLVLTCTTCDEPFDPQFLKRCEWCGHEFPDGHPVDVVEGPPEEEITPRALAVMVGLGLLAIGAIAYFLFLVPRK